MPAPINVLFVCGRNNRRSPTAAHIFRNDRRMNVRSGGVADTSRRKVSEGDLRWAQLVLVVERKYAGRLKTAFPKVDPFPPIECLDISDEYTFMQPELVEMLKSSVDSALETYFEEQADE